MYERSPGTKHYHVRRHYQHALLAYTHIQEALLPTFDHLLSTDLENKWFFSRVGKDVRRDRRVEPTFLLTVVLQ